MLIDSHCHLNFPDFKDDFNDVLERSEEAGVKVLQTICTKLSEFPDVLSISKKHANIYCSIGIHPHNVSSEPEFSPVEIIEVASAEGKIIGIGETGLDYYYEHSPRELQKESFRKHISVSRETGLPVIIHSRDADKDTASLLRSEFEKGSFPGVIHCFNGSKEVAQAALDCGLFISLAGIVTFKNANSLRDTVKDLPADRLLVETDAPFLAPVPKRGKRNEPSFVRYTADFAAGLLELDSQKFAIQTSKNFISLFRRVSDFL